MGNTKENITKSESDEQTKARLQQKAELLKNRLAKVQNASDLAEIGNDIVKLMQEYRDNSISVSLLSNIIDAFEEASNRINSVAIKAEKSAAEQQGSINQQKKQELKEEKNIKDIFLQYLTEESEKTQVEMIDSLKKEEKEFDQILKKGKNITLDDIDLLIKNNQDLEKNKQRFKQLADNYDRIMNHKVKLSKQNEEIEDQLKKCTDDKKREQLNKKRHGIQKSISINQKLESKMGQFVKQVIAQSKKLVEKAYELANNPNIQDPNTKAAAQELHKNLATDHEQKQQFNQRHAFHQAKELSAGLKQHISQNQNATSPAPSQKITTKKPSHDKGML